MFTLLLSLVLGLVAFAAVAATFDVIAAIVPGVLVFMIASVVLLLRRKRQIDEEMQKLVPMLQRQDVDGARRFLEEIRARHARWMPLLNGQIEAQLGMLDYYRLKFDEALPRLEKGQWQNWMGQMCIGAIHHRKGDHDAAWKWMDKAIKTAPKEALPYQVYAIVANKAGDQDRALRVLNQGLDVMKGNAALDDLKGRIANKKKIRTDKLGQAWYQFFPEDLAAQSHIANRRGGPMPGPGFRGPSVSKQMRRGR